MIIITIKKIIIIIIIKAIIIKNIKRIKQAIKLTVRVKMVKKLCA